MHKINSGNSEHFGICRPNTEKILVMFKTFIGKTCTIGRQISQQLFAAADVNAVPTLYRQNLFYEYPRKWALPFPPHPNPSHTISVEEQLASRTRTVPVPYPYRTHVPNVPYPCTQCTVPCTVPMYPVYRTLYRTHVPKNRKPL